MKPINIILLLAGALVLASCDRFEKIENGKMTRNGNIFYDLCERGKGRIIDMRSMSFELPESFKQAPCPNEVGYVYDSTDDELNVSIPSVITRGNLMAIGLGGHSMAFRPGIFYSDKEQKWKYSGPNMPYSPEVFLERMATINKSIEYGFVDSWSGGRCGRILSGEERFFDYIHEVEYYCWPHSTGNKRQVPFYIRAQQSIPKKKEGIPPKSDFTDLDNQLIKPVLDSLEFYPLPDEAFQVMADTFSEICDGQQNAFFSKKEIRTWDTPDRRGIILTMRDCGYDIPLPKIRVYSYDEIFEKTRDEQLGSGYFNATRLIPKEYQPLELIYTFGHGSKLSYQTIVQRREKDPSYSPPIRSGETWHVYKVPGNKFARIKQKLLALDVLKETQPVTRRIRDFTKAPSFFDGYPSVEVPYDAWYYVPPRYERTCKHNDYNYRAGFGFRYDAELKAQVIDINFDDQKTISTYRFVTLVEGD